MNKVAMLPASQRAELFSETARRKGRVPAVIEKDSGYAGHWVAYLNPKKFQKISCSRAAHHSPRRLI